MLRAPELDAGLKITTGIKNHEEDVYLLLP